MTVRVVAQGTVSAANLGAFKKFVADATAVVRRQERGRTLAYEFFSEDAGSEEASVLIHEVYADGEHLVAHLENLGELMSVVTRLFKIERILLSGNLPGELIDKFKALGSVRHYGETMSELG